MKRSATDRHQVANVHSQRTGRGWGEDGGTDLSHAKAAATLGLSHGLLTGVSTVRGVWQDGDFR